MKTALVIEGGGLRGVHTSGIMDVFLEKGLEFSDITAVSAGCLNAMSYVSKQHGRAFKANYNFMNDKRYFNFSNIFKGTSVFGFDFMFGDLSKTHLPFDYETFRSSPVKLHYTTTDIDTGKTVYFEKNDFKDVSKIGAATASLPFISPAVEIDGKYYLDGGISNAVPYEKPMAEGFDKIVIMLTRHKGYRKGKTSFAMERLYRHKYADNPKFLECLLSMTDRYNKKMDEIDKLEEEGKVFVIRPSVPIKVSRMERNVKKIKELYGQGLKDGNEVFAKLTEYIS